ncbi:MAG: AAA family ATPase [Candidatus Kerfeldbacteria bacterium]|nr:AAA family ATPase [Candidatus Kerfeldbacteria bacterium]
MSKTILIIITGPPCTGKTTLSKNIAHEFSLPCISKDEIKELLFDSLGVKDREWSKQVGEASFALLFLFVEKLLASGQSCILESDLKPEYDNDTLRQLINKYNVVPFQIQCTTDGEMLFERFKQRSESGERHPGHVDHLNYEEFKPTLLQGRREPLDVGGYLYTLDTTNFDHIDYQKLFNEIRSIL